MRGRMLWIGLSLLLAAGVWGCDGGPGTAPETTNTAREPSASASDDAHGDASARRRKQQRPNIIFVLVDTLRADRLGAYGAVAPDGGPAAPTPVFDQLAADGVLFERAIAPAPWTLPSMASLFTGFYPRVHRADNYAIVRGREGDEAKGGSVSSLRPQFVTLTEILTSLGYESAAFVSNPFMQPRFGVTQGFGHIDPSFSLAQRGGVAEGDQINAGVKAWLDQRESDKPLFLYVHYMDVHAPYRDNNLVQDLVLRVQKMPESDRTEVTKAEINEHPGYFKKSIRIFGADMLHRNLFGIREYWWARYDSCVGAMDQHLGELRGILREHQLWDDALVVIVADHGEALGEHGVWSHGKSAHQDQLHVPIAMRWTGELPAGKRLGASVRLFDVMPTILELLGARVPTELQAASLLPVITGAEDDRIALGEAVKEAPSTKALVIGKWKVLTDLDTGDTQLFDLDADPSEQQDLAGEHPDRAKAMAAHVKSLVKENDTIATLIDEGATPMSAPVDAAQLKALQALGYVGDDDDDANEAKQDKPDD